jgi:hypothetical protein
MGREKMIFQQRVQVEIKREERTLMNMTLDLAGVVTLLSNSTAADRIERYLDEGVKVIVTPLGAANG